MVHYSYKLLAPEIRKLIAENYQSEETETLHSI